MKIHDEMSQISVPEDLDEKTYQSILSAEKTVQKNRFRKKCAWSVLSCLVIIFGIIHVANPAMAENIPIIGSVFYYIQDVIDFKEIIKSMPLARMRECRIMELRYP